MEDEVVVQEVPDMEDEGEAGRSNKSTLVLSLTP